MNLFSRHELAPSDVGTEFSPENFCCKFAGENSVPTSTPNLTPVPINGQPFTIMGAGIKIGAWKIFRQFCEFRWKFAKFVVKQMGQIKKKIHIHLGSLHNKMVALS